MVESWKDVVTGLALFFIHPYLYLGILFMLVAGVLRVKRERKQFHFRIYDFINELTQSFAYSLTVGLALSVTTFIVGITLPFQWVLILAATVTISTITLQFFLVSPLFTIGLPLVIASLLSYFGFIKGLEWNNTIAFSLFVLMAILLVAETYLTYKGRKLYFSPVLKAGKRGKNIGAQSLKQLWIIPLLLMIPGDAISSKWDWWPALQLGNQSFDIILIPFGIGLQKTVQSMLPMDALTAQGMRLLRLTVATGVMAIVAYFYPVIIAPTTAVCIVLHIFFMWRSYQQDKEGVPTFVDSSKGIVILGIIPGSTAERMNLRVGEIITKVNNERISNVREFYRLLDRNRSFCRLEVVDHQGEPRMIQKAAYNTDHHELGLVFVEKHTNYLSS